MFTSKSSNFLLIAFIAGYILLVNGLHYPNRFKSCGQLPSSCADALSSRDKNGIYLLNAPHVGLKPFYAYCMQDPQNNGSAWTVFLNRQDGSVNFTRNYHAYVEGFGNLEGEYWLGLKYINALTTVTNQPQELWVHMENFKNQTANAKYRSFVLSDESNGYAISILGGYSGNAGDSLSYHQGKPFATYDKDAKSLSTPKCATRYGGGWWYGGTSCHESHLTGQYLNDTAPSGQGITWNKFGGLLSSKKIAFMAIRPTYLDY